MLPPVEDAVLQHYPDFAALYNTLTTAVLNPDGSTKNDPAAKERNAVREELKQYRLEAARNNLLIHAVSTANPSLPEAKPAPTIGRRKPQTSQPRQPAVSELPQPLLDLLLLLPPFLSNSKPLSPESTRLLLNNPPFSDFPSLLPQLASLVSTSLHSSAVHLARIANPATNPSYVHRSVPALPSHFTALSTTIAERKETLTKARLSGATALTSLLQNHAQALTQLLRVLEAKHGPIARSLEFRAAEVSLAAQRQETEAETALWHARRDTYTPEVSRALANYANHLRDARGRLGEAIRTLRGELEGYGVDMGGDADGHADGEERERGVGKEKTMREMARVYREMGRQVDEVKADLERLGRG